MISIDEFVEFKRKLSKCWRWDLHDSGSILRYWFSINKCITIYYDMFDYVIFVYLKNGDVIYNIKEIKEVEKIVEREVEKNDWYL